MVLFIFVNLIKWWVKEKVIFFSIQICSWLKNNLVKAKLWKKLIKWHQNFKGDNAWHICEYKRERKKSLSLSVMSLTKPKNIVVIKCKKKKKTMMQKEENNKHKIGNLTCRVHRCNIICSRRVFWFSHFFLCTQKKNIIGFGNGWELRGLNTVSCVTQREKHSLWHNY